MLRAFSGAPSVNCCPTPENVGYAAGPILLLNHLRYLSGPHGNGSLADGVAEWLITGNRGRITANAGERWFSPGDARHGRRGRAAWGSWAGAVMVLALAGGIVFPVVATGAIESARAIWRKAVEQVVPAAAPVSDPGAPLPRRS